MLMLVLMLEMPVSLGALREQMVALMVLRVASVELVKVLVLGLLLLLLGGGAWIGVCACVSGSWRPTVRRVCLRMSQQTAQGTAPAVMQEIPVPVLNSSRS